jgi:hypothetical protein
LKHVVTAESLPHTELQSDAQMPPVSLARDVSEAEGVDPFCPPSEENAIVRDV